MRYSAISSVVLDTARSVLRALARTNLHDCASSVVVSVYGDDDFDKQLMLSFPGGKVLFDEDEMTVFRSKDKFLARTYYLQDVPVGRYPGESLVDAADLVRLLLWIECINFKSYIYI